jgi:hypothetical protein|tara:strand:- start:1710 stop:1811 length:102 start_codon:yes stop_codon:yes gene_type:complete
VELLLLTATLTAMHLPQDVFQERMSWEHAGRGQ